MGSEITRDAQYGDLLLMRDEGSLPSLGLMAGGTCDVLEHINPEDEPQFLANLAASLSSDGVAIIGMPSLESQAYASPASLAGHVNCQSAPQLKAAMERHFGVVFMFSMNDEVVHTGFHKMANYIFAVAVGPRIADAPQALPG